jgi:hypothetical protein
MSKQGSDQAVGLASAGNVGVRSCRTPVGDRWFGAQVAALDTNARDDVS